jgi:hypothetical protein
LNVIERARNVILFLTDRKRAYQLAFGSPAGQAVLRDLAKFCRAADTEFHADPRIHAALSGRREVWLRIQQHINLTPEQLAALYDGRSITIGAKDD